MVIIDTLRAGLLCGSVGVFVMGTILLISQDNTAENIWVEHSVSAFQVPLSVFGTLLVFSGLLLATSLSTKGAFCSRFAPFFVLYLLCFSHYFLLWGNLVPTHVNVRGEIIHPIRFIMWLATLPITVFIPFSRCNLPVSYFFRCHFFAWMMTLAGWLASYTEGSVCYLAFSVSLVTFLALIQSLDAFVTRSHEGYTGDRLMFPITRWCTLLSWCIFPIAWLLSYTGYIPSYYANCAFSLGDIASKSLVTFTVELQCYFLDIVGESHMETTSSMEQRNGDAGCIIKPAPRPAPRPALHAPRTGDRTSAPGAATEAVAVDVC